MEISAHIVSGACEHDVRVRSGRVTRQIPVPSKASGTGSAINGGELLMAALATCYCNDLYREAARLGIDITACEVVATAQFDGVGRGAENIVYAARVESNASSAQIEQLLSETDGRAEIHNTLRSGCPVQRIAWSESTG